MRLDEIICEECCEVVYTNEEGEVLTEAAIRQFKRVGGQIKRQYRCTTGPKKGKIVATPQACAKRKDPKKRRHGRKVSRARKGVRVMKTRIAKKQQQSKLVTRMNRRISGR